MNYDRDRELIQPYYVIEEINRLTRGEAVIATGVGQHQMWAAQYFDFREPRLWLTSGSMGTIWLIGFKGIGPKTASIVLLFALGKPAFPVEPISIG